MTDAMSIDELRALPGETITPAIAASVLGCNPQFLRLAARERPELLGFQVCCIGSRVKIPKAAFIRFLTGETEGDE